ncbi:DUF6602 domain-containing protein [Halomonas elongata]|uniref:DUF6602 domain-containing protein n=1 Tax=Halomonas elongata TaxID=2746 RepID=UPI0023AFE5D5|nr:DUF6602 domain-containing protein [Halomonas elongata]
MLHKYFEDISSELERKSQAVREYFRTHKPSAGANREGMVASFLEEYLPDKYAISSGLILSKDGDFSNQADIIVADRMSNAPLFGEDNEKIWLVESVYSLIEVKTQLTPSTLRDSLEKCQKFKSLPREYASDFGRQNIKESLFVLWAFEGPSSGKIKENLEVELAGVPHDKRPDFIVVPGSTLVRAGHYYELSKLGQESSPHRAQTLAEFGGNVELALGTGFEVNELKGNTLLAWLVWYSSWLHAAGERRASLNNYVPQDLIWGQVV